MENTIANNTEETEESNFESCFVIHLKNTTDEKLFNVSILNYNHKEQSKIKYKGDYPDYDHILRQIASLRKSDNHKITKINFAAVNDYMKYAIRQVKCKVEFVSTGLNGTSYATKKDLAFYFTSEQVHPNVVDLPLEYKFSLLNGFDMRLEYLMPETTLSVCVFYQIVNEK